MHGRNNLIFKIFIPSKNMAFIMTLWIVNGAVLKSPSRWQFTIVRSKTSTFQLFEVTFLPEKWRIVCLISTFRVPHRSKSGWRKQVSYFQDDLVGQERCGSFLAPLAEGKRAIVMAWGRRASVRPFVRACVRKLFL